jgi:cysteine synthase
MKGVDLAKLEYVNPVGSIKDRPASPAIAEQDKRCGVKVQ